MARIRYFDYLITPLDYGAKLKEAALAVLHVIYKRGFKYSKADMMRMDLQPVSRHQFTLNLEPEEPASNPNRIQLMHALDCVNGRGTLNLASAVTAGEHRL